MTIFRDEFNGNFVALFTVLLFLKIFHWLMADRIAYMEQTPAVPLSTHARILVLMSSLAALDAALLHHAAATCLARGPSVLLLFAFESLILLTSVLASFVKYGLYVNDVRLGGRCEGQPHNPSLTQTFLTQICPSLTQARAPVSTISGRQPPTPALTQSRPFILYRYRYRYRYRYI